MVGGTGVAVGGTGVAVGGTGVAVGVSVGGIGVAVKVGVEVGGTGVADGVKVRVGRGRLVATWGSSIACLGTRVGKKTRMSCTSRTSNATPITR